MKAPPGSARAELMGLLSEILDGPGTFRRDLQSGVLAGAPLSSSLSGPVDARPDDAPLAALVDVHRVELARLLRRAARIALRHDEAAAPSARAALADALGAADADGLRLEPELRKLLVRCARVGVSGGARTAAELAVASLGLEETLAGRHLLAAALLDLGDGRGASAVLAVALASLARLGGSVEDERRSLVRDLARAQSSAGHARRAHQLVRLAERLATGPGASPGRRRQRPSSPPGGVL